MADARLSYVIDAKDRASSTFKKVSGAAKDTKKSLDETSTGAKRLTQQITETEQAVAKMRAEFERTGNADLLKNIRKGERELNNLRGWAQHFPREAEEAGKKLSAFTRIGVTAGNGLNFFATAATDAGGAAKIAMHPIGIAAVAVGAVAVGALASGAALAGLGAGLIGMGALALRNSQAAAKAVKDLGATVDGVAGRSARVLESHFIGALHELGTTAKNAEPSLTRMFSNVEPAVGELTTGLSGLVDNALPGLERASEGAREVLGDVARELPQVGAAVGEFGALLGEAADGGGEALVDTLSVLSMALKNTGAALAGAAKGYALAKDLLSGRFGGPGGAGFRDLDQAASASAQGFSTFAAGANMAKAAVEAEERANFSLAASMKNVSNMAIAAAGSEIAAIDSRHRMVDELKNGTRSLDINTDAGRRNKQSILDGVAAAIRYGEAETKRTGNADAGTAAQQRHTNAMYNDAVSVLKNRGAVDALWKALGLLPPSKTTKVSVPGAVQAELQIRAVKRTADAIERSINITVGISGTSAAYASLNQLKAAKDAAGLAHGGLVGNAARKNGFAGGGIVAGGGTRTSDSVPIWASRREFVTRASSVDSIGVKNMEFMNRTGKVPVAAGRGGGSPIVINIYTDGSISDIENRLVARLESLRRQNRLP